MIVCNNTKMININTIFYRTKLKKIVTFALLIIQCLCILAIERSPLRSCSQNQHALKLFNPSRVCLDSFIYILYDINPSEGFNLRRDAYIRIAVFVRSLRKLPYYNDKKIKLVLPPFRRLYHWKSSNIYQENLLWKQFFDINSMKKYTNILDFDEFVDELQLHNNPLLINEMFHLENFKEMFENGVFLDKFEIRKCDKNVKLPFFYEYNFKINLNTCVRFQGSAKFLEPVLRKSLNNLLSFPKILMFLNAEIVLHDQWGSAEFWKVRRSMRFSQDLYKIADNFRLQYFDSTNEQEMVQRPLNWKDEKPYRSAIGGQYLCAHIRRGDFVYGREKLIPTLHSTAYQIRAKLMEYNLTKVFISSDCSKFEFKNLKSYLGRVKVARFSPETLEMKYEIKDGGVAIVDQIICSHSRIFIGTYESTFTYRIYEEREILGFTKESTFNTFCKNADESECNKNSIWPIVY